MGCQKGEFYQKGQKKDPKVEKRNLVIKGEKIINNLKNSKFILVFKIKNSSKTKLS